MDDPGSESSRGLLGLLFDPRSFDRPDQTASTPTGTLTFEARGIPLHFLRQLGEAATERATLRRVLLRSGQTGIVLPVDAQPPGAGGDDGAMETPGPTEIAVEVRWFDHDSNLCRSYKIFDQEEVVCELPAAVGERVLAELDTRGLPTVDGRPEPGQPLDPRSRAPTPTFTRFDGVTHAPNCCGTVLAVGMEQDSDTVECSVGIVYDPVGSPLAQQSNHTLIVTPPDCTVRVSAGSLTRDPTFTTKDACEEVVKPLTRLTGRSVVEILDPSLTGPASVFISHAWQYHFADFVAAVELKLGSADSGPQSEVDGRSTDSEQDAYAVDISAVGPGSAGLAPSSSTQEYVWLDICTVRQHPELQLEFPPDFFFHEFRAGIQAIGRTVIVLSPLLAPIPVTRSWCVWEIFCTMETGAIFETALTPKDQRFVDTHTVARRVAVDVRAASAWSPDDAARILAVCETVGCDVIDGMVLEAFALDQVQHAISAHSKGTVPFLSWGALLMGYSACLRVADYLRRTTRAAKGVYMGGCSLTSREGCVAIAEAAGECAGLQTVSVHCRSSSPREETNFVGDAIVALTASLHRNPSITTLILMGTKMSVEDMERLISGALRPESVLTALTLEDHPGYLAAGSPPLLALTQALAANTALEKLHIRRCGVDDLAAEALGRALGQSSTSVLGNIDPGDWDVGSSSFTSKGAQRLLDGLLPSVRRFVAQLPPAPEAVGHCVDAEGRAEVLMDLALLEARMGKCAAAVETQKSVVRIVEACARTPYPNTKLRDEAVQVLAHLAASAEGRPSAPVRRNEKSRWLGRALDAFPLA
eukprot:m.210421 g.210421  ORF g.210421 m.210421 type:complete len:815 (-) comp15481_c0_seq3:138-2582(-)